MADVPSAQLTHRRQRVPLNIDWYLLIPRVKRYNHDLDAEPLRSTTWPEQRTLAHVAAWLQVESRGLQQPSSIDMQCTG